MQTLLSGIVEVGAGLADGLAQVVAQVVARRAARAVGALVVVAVGVKQGREYARVVLVEVPVDAAGALPSGPIVGRACDGHRLASVVAHIVALDAL